MCYQQTARKEEENHEENVSVRHTENEIRDGSKENEMKLRGN